jgi:hypothetical protein
VIVEIERGTFEYKAVCELLLRSVVINLHVSLIYGRPFVRSFYYINNYIIYN